MVNNPIHKISLLNRMAQQFFTQPLPQIDVKQLAQRMSEAHEGLQLIDVREEQEIAIAQIEGFENLPLSEFEQWSNQIQTRLNPEAETLVLCHHGVRSAQMCQWLMNQGFTNVKNIVGGIDAYSLVVDRSIPRY
jgi:rhodanese-related sulfurtransferase